MSGQQGKNVTPPVTQPVTTPVTPPADAPQEEKLARVAVQSAEENRKLRDEIKILKDALEGTEELRAEMEELRAQLAEKKKKEVDEAWRRDPDFKPEIKTFYLTKSRHLQQAGEMEPSFIAAAPEAPATVQLAEFVWRNDKQMWVDQVSPSDTTLKKAPPAALKDTVRTNVRHVR